MDREQILRQRRGRKLITPLPVRVKAALADFQSWVLEMFPEEIIQIILYGSYARGDASPDSDVDVMVIVKWENPQSPGKYYLGGPGDERWRKIINAATDAMIAHGPYLSVLVIGENLFNSNFTVAQAAKEEGNVLWMSQPT